MTGIESILAAYEAGAITRRERVIALARLITPETVVATLSSLPDEVARDLVQWAHAVPSQGGVMIGGNLSGDAARKLAGQLQVAAQAIREREQGGGGSAEQPAGRKPGEGMGDANGVVEGGLGTSRTGSDDDSGRDPLH
jgi:hypothetical protein